MTELAWKDVTEYHCRDKRRLPLEFELRTGRLNIAVHRHIDWPGDWYVTCDEIGMRCVELDSVGSQDAKDAAVIEVRVRLAGMLDSLPM